MIALYLLDKPGTAVSPPIDQTHHLYTDTNPTTTPTTLFPPPDPHTHLASRRVLLASHRPALIPYSDPLVSLASRLLFLPARVLLPHSSSASSSVVSLTVPLVERASFPPGSLPQTLFLELQAGQSLRVAAASVTLTAQLSGVRFLMHRYRASAFLAGTAAFWGCEVVFMGVAWAVLSSVLSSGGEGERGRQPKLEGGKERKGIKGEEGEGVMSDTERTFPTTSRAPPLKYESSGGIKEEIGLAAALSMAELPVAGGEADDEDDEPEEGWRDSGIGTSYSDAGAGTGGVRRRVSGKGR